MKNYRLKQLLQADYIDYVNNTDVISIDQFIELLVKDKNISEKFQINIRKRELTYKERYKLWFSNNYETGMEYYENIIPDFENSYYEPTPKFVITFNKNGNEENLYE